MEGEFVLVDDGDQHKDYTANLDSDISELKEALYTGHAKASIGLFGAMINTYVIVSSAYAIEFYSAKPSQKKAKPKLLFSLRSCSVRWDKPFAPLANDQQEVTMCLYNNSTKTDYVIISHGENAVRLYGAIAHAIQRIIVLDPYSYPRIRYKGVCVHFVGSFGPETRYDRYGDDDGGRIQYDGTGECDPYVYVTVDGVTKSTHVVNGRNYAQYGVQWSFAINVNSIVSIQIRNKNVARSDGVVADKTIPLSTMYNEAVEGSPDDIWLDMDNTARAHIRMAMAYDCDARRCMLYNVQLCRESIDECVMAGDVHGLTRPDVPWSLVLAMARGGAVNPYQPSESPYQPSPELQQYMASVDACQPIDNSTNNPYSQTSYDPQAQPEPVVQPASQPAPAPMVIKEWPSSSINTIVNLGVSRDGALAVLTKTNGDVDAAANMLLDNLSQYQLQYGT